MYGNISYRTLLPEAVRLKNRSSFVGVKVSIVCLFLAKAWTIFFFFFWKEGFPLPLYFKKKNSSSTAFSARPPHREECLKEQPHTNLSQTHGITVNVTRITPPILFCIAGVKMQNSQVIQPWWMMTALFDIHTWPTAAMKLRCPNSYQIHHSSNPPLLLSQLLLDTCKPPRDVPLTQNHLPTVHSTDSRL